MTEINNSLTVTEHLVLWLIGIFFILLYFMYDKYKLIKLIGDLFISMSFWSNKKGVLLTFAIPPISLSILFLIYEFVSKING